MSDEAPDVARALLAVWGKLMIEKNFEDALNTGLMAYRISTKHDDLELAAGSISWMVSALNELISQRKLTDNAIADETSCSFCGRSQKETELFGGAKARICTFCLDALNIVAKESIDT